MSDQPVTIQVELKDVYLCYNSADAAWVKNLAEQLESETIDGLPKSRRLRVFLDVWDIDSGESLIQKMNEGMKHSRYIATVLSPEFMKAPWPTFEWTHIVSIDPMNVQRRLIPLLRRDVSLNGSERIDLCAPFRGLKYLDFRRDLEFNRSFRALVRRIRGQPQERGTLRAPLAAVVPVIASETTEQSWLPDKVEEVLLSNLLVVESLPAQIWSAETSSRSKSEVRDVVTDPAPFILKEGKLYTFENLKSTSSSLRKAVDMKTAVEPDSSKDWLLHDDRRRWLMHLLNDCLTKHLSRLAIKQERRGRYFFRPTKEGMKRVWKNAGDREREVAAEKLIPGNKGSFWVHHAARARFCRIGERVFLQVEPTYLFTSDGQIPLEGQSTGRLSMMWGGKQKNVDILRNFIFWSKAMAKSTRSLHIATGGAPIVVSAVPATARMNVGIEGETVQIGSLMNQLDHELDEAASDVELADVDDEETEDTEEE